MVNNNLINAVFDIDYNQFMEIVNSDGLEQVRAGDNSVLQDVEFPLHYITICWDILFAYIDEWKEEYQDSLRARKEKNDLIKAYFIKEMGLNMDSIPFSDYCDLFYCSDADDSVEDCLGETAENLRKKGFRDIDIELACCVNKFQFEEVKRLLDLGADPGLDYSEDDENCLSRIDVELDFIYSDFMPIVLGSTAQMSLDNKICRLLGLAAHEKMMHLIDV